MSLPSAGDAEWEFELLVKVCNIYKMQKNLISQSDISSSLTKNTYT